MRVIIKLATVAVLVLTLGLHWALLQTVAWTGMVLSYSRNASLPEALSRTFDGQHPCALCQAIAKGKNSEKQSETLAPLKKIDGLYQPVVLVVCSPASFSSIEPTGGLLEMLAHAPPTPPPRAV